MDIQISRLLIYFKGGLRSGTIKSSLVSPIGRCEIGIRKFVISYVKCLALRRFAVYAQNIAFVMQTALHALSSLNGVDSKQT